MKKNENESAVSESIGVVLVVALTVIMASIIAAYLFGMMSGVPQTHSIAVTATKTDPTHISVTYRGGPDQTNLGNLSIIWPDGTNQMVNLPKVGDVYTATNVGAGPQNVTAGKNHVVVTAIWKNNQTQVVLDTLI